MNKSLVSAVVVSTLAAGAKLSAGDAAILACQTKGADNKTLIKALWSTRGEIRVQAKGFPEEFGGIVVNKANLVATIQALAPADKCGFLLVPFKDGANLIPG